MELLHEELTKSIIKIFYEVYNELGYAFFGEGEGVSKLIIY
jgi:hypothetical protein